jgi:hypothetical protein
MPAADIGLALPRPRTLVFEDPLAKVLVERGTVIPDVGE